MNIRQLECFRTLMLHGTMTRAAELLGISQPAVSNLMALLAKEVGFRLFARHGGRLQPTPEARLFYTQVERALEGIESIGRIADEIRKGRRGHLSIVAYPSISISLLPRMVSLFMAKRPELKVKMIARNSQGVRDLATTQQFDLAIAELPLDYPSSHMEIFTYECQCMLPTDHRLADRDVITATDLDGEPFITLFNGDPIYQQVATAFSQAGARWNVVAETEFFSTACELVAAGCGVGIIDPVISNPFTADVVKKRFLPKIEYQVAILYPTSGVKSQIAEEFVDMLRLHLAA